MNKEELEYRIKIYHEDLEEAIAQREVLADLDVEAEIDAEIAEKREEIANTFYEKHNQDLADADKDIERMKIVIEKRENELAELLANEEVVLDENLEEGE